MGFFKFDENDEMLESLEDPVMPHLLLVDYITTNIETATTPPNPIAESDLADLLTNLKTAPLSIGSIERPDVQGEIATLNL